MDRLALTFFAIAAGFTVSGIAANLYMLVCHGLRTGSEGRLFRVVRAAVMIVAGPNVLFKSALGSVREKKWSLFYFWIVIALVGYWSFAIGLLVLNVVTAI